MHQGGRNRYAVLAAVVVLVVSLVVPTRTVSAEESAPAPDVTAPVVELNILEEVRNTTALVLRVDDQQPAYAEMSVVDAAGALVPGMHVQNDTGTPQLRLDWNTNNSPDGAYKVTYAVRDAAGNETRGEKTTIVNNAKPFVVLHDTAFERTIGGTVSRSDVTFLITVDGEDLAIAPTIAADPDPTTGNYIWSLKLPADIRDGAHIVHSVVTVNGEGGLTSDPSDKLITFSTTVPVKPTDEAPQVTVPVGKPTLELAPEIGTFIAPVIPTAPVTSLFGVTTTDLTDTTSAATTRRESSVLPATRVSQSHRHHADRVIEGDGAAVAATERGWVILGAAWYWWLLLAGVFMVGGVAWRILFPATEKSRRFVRAESWQ